MPDHNLRVGSPPSPVPRVGATRPSRTRHPRVGHAPKQAATSRAPAPCSHRGTPTPAVQFGSPRSPVRRFNHLAPAPRLPAAAARTCAKSTITTNVNWGRRKAVAPGLQPSLACATAGRPAVRTVDGTARGICRALQRPRSRTGRRLRRMRTRPCPNIRLQRTSTSPCSRIPPPRAPYRRASPPRPAPVTRIAKRLTAQCDHRDG